MFSLGNYYLTAGLSEQSYEQNLVPSGRSNAFMGKTYLANISPAFYFFIGI